MLDLRLHDVEVEYIVAALIVQKYDFFYEMNCGPEAKQLEQAMLYNATKVTELIMKIEKQLSPEARLKLANIEKKASESYNNENINRAIKFVDTLLSPLYGKKEKEI